MTAYELLQFSTAVVYNIPVGCGEMSALAKCMRASTIKAAGTSLAQAPYMVSYRTYSAKESPRSGLRRRGQKQRRFSETCDRRSWCRRSALNCHLLQPRRILPACFIRSCPTLHHLAAWLYASTGCLHIYHKAPTPTDFAQDRMAIDFPIPPLRRFLWDHLSEIVSPDDVAGSSSSSAQGDHGQQQHAWSPHGPGSGDSGVSGAWAAGTGHEGFDGFRIELKKFSSGQSNPTFLLEVHLSPPPAAATSTTTTTSRTSSRANNKRKFVLRKKPASVTVSSAHAVEREFRILRALRLDPASDVLVPRPLLLCEDPAVIGTPFYVMEFVQGRIFSDAALPGLAPAERAAAYESAAETLARLHHVDFVRAGLGGFGRGEGGYLGRQVATLERVAAKQVLL